jgi:hypothetical protein
MKKNNSLMVGAGLVLFCASACHGTNGKESDSLSDELGVGTPLALTPFPTELEDEWDGMVFTQSVIADPAAAMARSMAGGDLVTEVLLLPALRLAVPEIEFERIRGIARSQLAAAKPTVYSTLTLGQKGQVTHRVLRLGAVYEGTEYEAEAQDYDGEFSRVEYSDSASYEAVDGAIFIGTPDMRLPLLRLESVLVIAAIEKHYGVTDSHLRDVLADAISCGNVISAFNDNEIGATMTSVDCSGGVEWFGARVGNGFRDDYLFDGAPEVTVEVSGQVFSGNMRGEWQVNMHGETAPASFEITN